MNFNLIKMKYKKFNKRNKLTNNWNFNVRREQSASWPTLINCTLWLCLFHQSWIPYLLIYVVKVDCNLRLLIILEEIGHNKVNTELSLDKDSGWRSLTLKLTELLRTLLFLELSWQTSFFKINCLPKTFATKIKSQWRHCHVKLVIGLLVINSSNFTTSISVFMARTTTRSALIKHEINIPTVVARDNVDTRLVITL